MNTDPTTRPKEAPAMNYPVRHPETRMIEDYVPATTYADACDHVEAQYQETNGLVCGGTFWVVFEVDGLDEARQVELRVSEATGLARLV